MDEKSYLSVFKYSLEPNDYFSLKMPKGAKILKVDMQGSLICMWALVNPKETLTERKFRWAGTGHPIFEKYEQLNYISTFFMNGPMLVFHIFEIVK